MLNWFRIDSFQPLENEGFPEALTKLRAVPGLDWGDDIVDEFLRLRYGEGDGENANGGVR